MPQINLSITDDLNAQLESATDTDESRQDLIRKLIRDEVGPSMDPEPDNSHTPEKDRDAGVYEALLEHGGEEIFSGKIRLTDVLPEVCVDTQISKEDVYRSLKRMERNNHVRLDHGGIYTSTGNGLGELQLRARPPQADPDEWTGARSHDNGMAVTLDYPQPGERHAIRSLREELENTDAGSDSATNGAVATDGGASMDELEAAEVADE